MLEAPFKILNSLKFMSLLDLEEIIMEIAVVSSQILQHKFCGYIKCIGFCLTLDDIRKNSQDPLTDHAECYCLRHEREISGMNSM